MTDLLQRNGSDFVYQAYQAVLERPPEKSEIPQYVRALHRGFSKMEILSILRDSAEGKKVVTQLNGLPKTPLLFRIYRLPLIGRGVRNLVGRNQSRALSDALCDLEDRLLTLEDECMHKIREVAERNARELKEIRGALAALQPLPGATSKQ